MLKFTFLGTADARRVPVYGCRCIACEAALRDADKKRAACSGLFECDGRKILIDAGRTDLCETFPHGVLDAVVLTHFHMDHVMGLFHMRWGEGIALPVYCPDDDEGCGDLYKHSGLLDFRQPFQPFESRKVAGVSVTPLPLRHSKLTLGYLFAAQGRKLAYLTDTIGLPEKTSQYLTENPPDAMILDCSKPPGQEIPRNHNDLTIALEIIERINPQRAYLTHIGHDLDRYFIQHPELPERVAAARDGMEIELDAV